VQDSSGNMVASKKLKNLRFADISGVSQRILFYGRRKKN